MVPFGSPACLTAVTQCSPGSPASTMADIASRVIRKLSPSLVAYLGMSTECDLRRLMRVERKEEITVVTLHVSD